MGNKLEEARRRLHMAAHSSFDAVLEQAARDFAAAVVEGWMDEEARGHKIPSLPLTVVAKQLRSGGLAQEVGDD